MNDRNQALHPNLARLAAAYDHIFTELSAHRLSPEQARQAVLELVDRDDQGVRWRINPANGAWYRETLDAQWVPDTPPTYGVATVSAADISPGGAGHPAHNVLRGQVDPNVLMPPDDEGTLWRTDQTKHQTGKTLPEALTDRKRIIIVGAVIAVIAAVLLSLGSRDGSDTVIEDGIQLDPQTGQPADP